MSRRLANVCPQCGSTVSVFAAGCAICGADLEAYRAQRSRIRGLALPSLPSPIRPLRLETADVVLIVVLLLLTIFSPLFGLLIGLLGAYYRDREGRTAIRNVAGAFALLSLLALLFPSWTWAHVTSLFY